MIVALDVGYTDGEPSDRGRCAVVAINGWADADTAHELIVEIAEVAPYVSGRLYERELPCLVAGLEALQAQASIPPDIVIVDGNVRLDPAGAPGLGMYLYEHLGSGVPVVGVAKNEYAGLDAQLVLRGTSKKPLYVTAAGMDESVAADRVRSMAGEFRLPTILRRVDALTRRESGT